MKKLKYALAFSLAVSASAPIAAEKNLPFPEKQKDIPLETFCSEHTLHSRKTQNFCFQKSAFHTLNFSKHFANTVGLSAEKQKIFYDKTIEKDSPRDYQAFQDFAVTCTSVRSPLIQAIQRPSYILNKVGSNWTGLTLGCVTTALELSEKYDIKINRTYGESIQNVLGSIYNYYQKNPNIPETRSGDTLPRFMIL